jgi:Holliday junction resolvase RusA-like endonuclease
MEINFTVPGEPRGKGRPRFSKYGGHTYTDSETRAYENKIVAYYRKSCGGFRFPDSAFVSVDIVAYLPIPKSATKAQQAAMESMKVLPSRKPDTDNIAKAVLDALNGVAYKDDARVVDIRTRKYYGAVPGLAITIKEVIPE